MPTAAKQLFDPANHPWFTPWRDPGSGITSHILQQRVAPFQRAMYHTVRAPGQLIRLCTHLQLSPDGRHFLVDAHIGNAFHIALIELATGTTKVLKRFYHNHHHTLFSPPTPI